MAAITGVGKYKTGKIGLELATRFLAKDHHISNEAEEAVMTGRTEGRSYTARYIGYERKSELHSERNHKLLP